MKDLLEEVLQLRKQAGDLQVRIAKEHSTDEGEPPLGGLGMCFNNATLTFELLKYYYDLWGKLAAGAGLDVEKVRRENGERVVVITKWMYIQNLSGFEYSAKAAIRTHGEALQLGKGRIYLRKIMDRSHKAGILSKEALEAWRGAIEVRNTLVHNNGIAEKDMVIAVPAVALTLKSGEMAQGDLKTFVRLSNWTTESFGAWCDGFLGAV